jgi:hypothetical protein
MECKDIIIIVMLISNTQTKCFEFQFGLSTQKQLLKLHLIIDVISPFNIIIQGSCD